MSTWEERMARNARIREQHRWEAWRREYEQRVQDEWADIPAREEQIIEEWSRHEGVEDWVSHACACVGSPIRGGKLCQCELMSKARSRAKHRPYKEKYE